MTLWDSHCHLADARFDADRADVCARAAAAGVEGVVVVAADPEGWVAARRLRQAAGGPGPAPRLVHAFGMHPQEAQRAAPDVWQSLGEHLRAPGAVAVGEIGLDFLRAEAAPARQREVLERQLALAAEARLPIILHERQAAAELLAVLRSVGVPPAGGVWHCFSGGPDLAAEACALGLHLGFGGLVTFRRDTGPIRRAAAECPAERLLLETDAPYLAPEPHRGRRNEPARVADVARFVAELRGLSPDELAAVTTANARRLFARTAPVVTGA